MMKYEAKFGLLFRHYLKAHPEFASAAFELKQSRTGSIPFDSVEPHQIDALLAAETKKGILFKLADDSRGIKPFDYFLLTEADAFVVILYPKLFVLIRVNDFVKERDNSSRKSLTSERAQQIAYKVIRL